MRQSILFQFIVWYFFEIPREMIRIWRNFLLFNFNFFSIPLLFKTLFSHWRRYKYSYGTGFDLHRYLDAFSFNAVSRAIGTVVRSFTILTGLFCEILILILGLFVIIGWLILPIFLIFTLLYGFGILF